MVRNSTRDDGAPIYTSIIDVEIELGVGAGRLSGELRTQLYAYLEDTFQETNATFSFDTDIVGNGFEADMTLACDDGFTCTGGGQIGGAFYATDAGFEEGPIGPIPEGPFPVEFAD